MGIAFTFYQDTKAMFVINNVKSFISDNDTVTSSETILYPTGEVQTLINEYHWIAAVFFSAEQMTDGKTTCIALLHDVEEDTDITFEQLTSEGFPSEITKALKLMTHDKSVTYMEYVEKMKRNFIAREVKLAELKHNSN